MTHTINTPSQQSVEMLRRRYAIPLVALNINVHSSPSQSWSALSIEAAQAAINATLQLPEVQEVGV